MTHMIRVQGDCLATRSLIDRDFLVKDSSIEMAQQLPGTQSTRDFMKVNDDITENQSSMAVLIKSCRINKRGLHE